MKSLALTAKGDALLAEVATTLSNSPFGKPTLVLAQPHISHISKALSDAFTTLDISEGLSPEAGLGDSIAATVASVRTDTTHALLVLGDQIGLTNDDYRGLWHAFNASPEKIHCAISDAGLSPPVIFPRAYFDQLRQLSGERGAKALLNQLPEAVQPFAMASAAIDIDTPAQLARWNQQHSVSQKEGVSHDQLNH
ncbi:hypothetical protein GCM10007895_20030 [Paraferrimonas sedimenticola]|uniref:MobA-like NTP transferase domain-containing protein n=1 Tax=Paraferrimonas sedimenticola TaxID=375674 RepID=A0AA37RXZ9_9GAMM|nr:hypothetical protein GCM10007895_20030 [Paraferrimonas sedimenticola]